MSTDKDILVKEMAKMLKQGATLTQFTCPRCGTPLLRTKTGSYICLKCRKQVYIARNEEDERRILFSFALNKLEDSIINKLNQLTLKLNNENDIEELGKIAKTVTIFLESLEKVSKIKSGWEKYWQKRKVE